MKRLALLTCLAAVFACAPAHAQDRYELGRRLRLFERALEEASGEARARAMPVVNRAVMAFFLRQAGLACRSLDEARFALGEAPPDAERWAAGLGWVDAGRVHDLASGAPAVRLGRSYRAREASPPGLSLSWTLQTGDDRLLGRGEEAQAPRPWTLTLPGELPEGDHLLRCQILSDGRPVAHLERGLSVVRELERRLERARLRLAALSADAPWEERAAIAHKLELLQALSHGTRSAETDLPGARLLRDVEQALAALDSGERFHAGRAGEDWVRLGSAARSTPARLLVPPGAGPRPPLVVALHGMGGSENMFFDAYGAGLIARLCRERGWLLVAPRASGAPLSEVLDSLSRLHAYDRQRVVVVGHSMGAMQAAAAVSDDPDRYAAAAFLAGGGRVGRSPLPPCFVGTGARDFSAPGARALARRLEGRAAPLVVREYPAEHLTVVQLALRDVFAFFESVLPARSTPQPPTRYGPL